MRTDIYLQGLKECCGHLASQPLQGRKVEARKGYFRYDYVSHTIFYKRRKGGIIIMRILHHHMDTPRHM